MRSFQQTLLIVIISLPLAAFSAPTPLEIEGNVRSSFSVEGEVKLLDSSLVKKESWNESEDLRSTSATGALRYEVLENDEVRLRRIFYEIDPKTRQSHYLFYLENYTYIKKWDEDANGIHLQYCYNSGLAPSLNSLDVATGNYSEVNGCVNRAILMPTGEYWSFFASEFDHSNHALFFTDGSPVYSNLKPFDVSALPADLQFDSSNLALSQNSRFAAIQDYTPEKNGTYVFDFEKRKFTQFKSARGGGYSRSVASNDGNLVSSYGPSSPPNFGGDFLQVFTKDGSKAAMTFVPSLRQDDSPMWKFDDVNFSLDSKRIITTASSKARDPNTQKERTDVDIFDIKSGRHLLRLQLSSIVRFLGHDRALVQSIDDRSFRVVYFGSGLPKVTHRFAYPPTADLSQEMNASFAGNTLAITYAKATYFFELPPTGE